MHLYSVSGTFALLKNSTPKLIGDANYSTRKQDSQDINCAEVKFHFGTEHEDYFYFEDDILIVSKVYEKRDRYIQDCYAYCMNEMSVKEFIEHVTEAYILTNRN